jgi:hypothetical protein
LRNTISYDIIGEAAISNLFQKEQKMLRTSGQTRSVNQSSSISTKTVLNWLLSLLTVCSIFLLIVPININSVEVIMMLWAGSLLGMIRFVLFSMTLKASVLPSATLFRYLKTMFLGTLVLICYGLCVVVGVYVPDNFFWFFTGFLLPNILLPASEFYYFILKR